MFHPKGIFLKRQKHPLGKLNKDIRLAGAKKREIEIGVAIVNNGDENWHCYKDEDHDEDTQLKYSHYRHFRR